MSAYRDDLEATRARAESLEEENLAFREREAELEAKAEALAARERELDDAKAEARAETREARDAKEKAQKLARRVEEERAERERDGTERAEERAAGRTAPTDDRVVRELSRLDREWNRRERELVRKYFGRTRGMRVLTRGDLSLMRFATIVMLVLFTGLAVYASTLQRSFPVLFLLPPGVAIAAFVAIGRAARGIDSIERARATYKEKRAATLGRGAKKSAR